MRKTALLCVAMVGAAVVVAGCELVAGRPETLTLKQCLEFFIEHRTEVVRRRTAHQLRKAEDRAHVVEGLRVAIINIDEVLAIFRS